MKQLDLGKDKIGKLLLTFSIPCIISLVVNALYNIIDQVFIGRGVGYLGNGATNVVFPIVVLSLAFSLMIGDGAAAYLSLKLGEKKKKDAQEGVANAIVAIVIVSIVLCVLVLAFLPQLLNIFGCTDALREYALDYGYVIGIGLPMSMIGTTLSAIIRADGSPKYSMASMLAGAICNIILDPIAIFLLGLGVKGAAIATVISQIVSCVMNLLYLKRFKTISISKDSFKISFKRMRTVAMLGISSFITQMAVVVIITVENKLYNTYAATSKFGSDIPITVQGIVMKINQILSSIIIGIAAGSQPIVGFNYGAGKYDRVKETLKRVLIVSVIVSTIAFILFQTIPEYLISLFGSGDATYNEFACLSFRIYLMLTIFNGIQIVSGIFFQAIGKPSKSAFLTLSRQILFYVPAAIILTKIFGTLGVLYAGPVADGLAFIIAAILLIIENKYLSENKQADKVERRETNKEDKLHKNITIVINREYGSGGRYVGKLLAEKLGITLYDKNLITMVSDKSGLSEKFIKENEQNKSDNVLANFNSYNNLTNDDNLFIAESEAIEEAAKQGPCVIVGRCADYILKDTQNLYKIFLYSDDAHKVERAVEHYGLEKDNALKEINKINKQREKHYNYYTNQKWKDLNNYDIALNVDLLGAEKTAELLYNIIVAI